MNFAYFTISVLIIIYAVFAFVSIRNNRWHYLFAHPFTFCILNLLTIFYAHTSYPGMEWKVEFWVTISCVITCVSYWIVYCFVSEKWIISISNNYICSFTNKDTVQFNSTFAFWIITLFGIASLPFTFLVSYICTGELMGLFAHLYTGKGASLINAGQFQRFFFRLLNISQLFSILVPCYVFVEAFLKSSKFNSFCCRFFVVFAILSSLLSQAYTGFRHRPLTIILIIFVLLVFYVARKEKVSRVMYGIYPLLCIITLFSVLLLPQIRHMQWDKAIGTIPGKVQNEKFIERGLTHILLMQPQNVIKNNHEKATVILNSASDTESNSEQNKITLEKQFLNQFHAVNVPDYIAWSMVNFDTHEPFFGSLWQLRFYISLVTPREFYTNRVKPTSIEREIHKRLRHQKGELGGAIYFSPFGDGFVAHGYIGGILSSVIWGMVYGFMSKFVITYFQNFLHRYDAMIFSLCLLWTVIVSFRGSLPTRLLYMIIPCLTFLLLCSFLKYLYKIKSSKV